MKHVFSISACTALFVVMSAHIASADAIHVDKNGLALKGYDPVAYFVAGKATPGKAEFSHTVDGATYRFASADSRDRFKKDPAAYRPQFGGFCAYAVSRGYTASTDPTAWKIVDGKLYLNYNHKVKAEWQMDIPGNIAKANKNWPSLSKKKS